MRRAGQFGFAKARERRFRTFRRNLKHLGFAIPAFGACILPVWFLIDGRMRDFATGALVGSCVVAIWRLLSDSPQAARDEVSAYAEVWTSDRLQKELGSGWWIIDHIVFDGFDVDHVVIGPGGVFAVETKWCGSGCTVTPTRIERYGRDPIAQASDAAGTIRSFLRTDFDVPVSSVVCLWGEDIVDEMRVPRYIEGTRVLLGKDSEWKSAFAGDALARITVEAIRDALDGFIVKRDAHLAANPNS